MALEAIFQKLTGEGGGLTISGAELSNGARLLRVTMFFCKHVISVAALSLLFLSLGIFQNDIRK